jgi:two-component system nitrogen regulation response regulator GlnG
VTDLSTVPPALLGRTSSAPAAAPTRAPSEDHAGVFEQAHGGTLFLDEIANLDLELQRQLLLVLERGSVTRLGDTRPRPATPKLVAATNEDVEALVHAGRFRSDLYMRLNPATRLRVPPLRERREDLPELVRFAFLEALRSEPLRPLVRAYLAQFPTPEDFDETETRSCSAGRARRRRGATRSPCSSAARRWRALVEHDWPGNHRELKLLAANALVFCLTRHLDVAPRAADAARAPAVLEVPDPLVTRLLGAVATKRAKPRVKGAPARAASRSRCSPRRASRASPRTSSASTCARCSTRAAAICADGAGAAGPRGIARQVHLRLNQLGLRLRDMRKTRDAAVSAPSRRRAAAGGAARAGRRTAAPPARRRRGAAHAGAGAATPGAAPRARTSTRRRWTA